MIELEDFFYKIDPYSREAYELYKSDKNRTFKALNEYKKWRVCIARIVRAMGELEAKSKNGLYIEGLGYFYREALRDRRDTRESIFRDPEIKTYYAKRFTPDTGMEQLSFTNNTQKSEVEYAPNMELVKIKREVTNSLRSLAVIKDTKGREEYFKI